MSFKDTAKPIIYEIAKQYAVDPNIVFAIIDIESSWNPKAVRFEPHYKYIYNVEKFAKMNNVSFEKEKQLQMTSLGLMQVMGGTARYLQFMGPLTNLFEVAPNVNVGCKLLSKLCKTYSTVEDVAAAYNGGSPRRDSQGLYLNQKYVSKFLAHYKAS